MYFTIENPDHRLIEQIQIAKKFSDDSNYEKSLFLFNVTQDIRMPITNINKNLNEIYNLDDIEEIKEQVRHIDSHTKELYNIVNSVLDISSVDVKDIKVTGIAELFQDEFCKFCKPEIKIFLYLPRLEHEGLQPSNKQLPF